MDYFSELKRRNVFKVAVAYLVVSWIMVQVADTIAPMMNLPESAPRLILYILIILFPIALFLAWAFEIKATGNSDESSERASPVSNLFPVILGVLMLAGLGYFMLRDAEPEPVSEEIAIEQGPSAESIAVLAFADLSSEGDQEYFGDGISDAVLNVLTKFDDLSVSSRTSSFAFKGADRNVTEIANILNVAHILEGSVKKAGNRVLITAQLIDASANRQIWSDTYERELTTENIFAIQAEIASSIVDALGVELGISLQGDLAVASVTENMGAYDLYLQAQKLLTIQSTVNSKLQVELMERAVALDPDFAEAWALLALSLMDLPTWDDNLDMAQYQHRAIEAAERAVELDPLNMMAKVTLVSAYSFSHQWQKADDMVARLQQLSPGYVKAPARLMGLGYLSQANEEAKRLEREFPEEGLNNMVQALYSEAMGQNEEAIKQFGLTALKGYNAGIDDDLAAIYWQMGNVSVWSVITAKEMVRFDPELVPLLPHMRDLMLALPENRERALERFTAISRELGFSIDDLLSKGPNWGLRVTYDFAVMLGGAGKIADILWSNEPKLWMWSQRLHEFRQSEPFREKVRNSGMLAYWQKNGWPDLCRAIGDDDFVCD